MKTYLTAVLAILGAWVIIGCGAVGGPPGEAAAEAALKARVASESGGVATLAAFRKTDGVAEELMGRKFYRMSCEATVVFQKACIWKFRPDFMTEVSFAVALPGPAGTDYWANFLHVTQNPGLQMKAGQRVRIVGRLVFAKSENGWRIDHLQNSDVRLDP
jgi:hypothetical protein